MSVVMMSAYLGVRNDHKSIMSIFIPIRRYVLRIGSRL